MKYRKKPDGFSLSATASQASVREALAELRQALAESGATDDLCSTVEIALAEALNNIAEHAYAGGTPGPMDISAQLGDDTVRFVLRDKGHEMPGAIMPAGNLPDHDVPFDDLPEGGFGWYLLHSLTQSLDYQRQNGENQLTLTFARS